MQAYSSQVWYQYLTHWQQELVVTAYTLLEREKNANVNLSSLYVEKADNFDYSFIIFPMAKAYEGFLKKYLHDLDLIDDKTYGSKRFRIGRALNPDVSKKQRDNYWLYDDIAQECGEAMARQLWEAWLECRNRVFHFFPLEKGKLTLEEAEKKHTILTQAMADAVACSYPTKT